MSADANQEQTQTETPVTETPATQPDTQGSVSPSQDKEPEAGSAQQAQGANSQHNNDFVPRWRLNEEIQKRRELESRFQTPPQQQPTQPKPADDGRPKQEDFQTYEEFVRADARFEARQELARARQEEQQQNQAKSFQERVRKAEESFSEKLYDAATKNPALMQKLQNAPALRPDLQLYGLKESDMPVALAEHLADNPVLVLQLNQMPPERALREMGKIEAKLAGSSGQPPKKPSAGIPALDAVGAGNKPGNKSADQLSQDDVISRLYPTS
jgi:hypothetical protein